METVTGSLKLIKNFSQGTNLTLRALLEVVNIEKYDRPWALTFRAACLSAYAFIHLSTFRIQIRLKVKIWATIALKNDEDWLCHNLVMLLACILKTPNAAFDNVNENEKWRRYSTLIDNWKIIFEENKPLGSLWFQNYFKKMFKLGKLSTRYSVVVKEIRYRHIKFPN